jgi:DNA-binding response OmpR family regulator
LVQSVLISDLDDSWGHKVQDYFRRSNMYADVAYSGKEALLFLFKKKYDCLLIDISTKNHSAFDVMK